MKLLCITEFLESGVSENSKIGIVAGTIGAVVRVGGNPAEGGSVHYDGQSYVNRRCLASASWVVYEIGYADVDNCECERSIIRCVLHVPSSIEARKRFPHLRSFPCSTICNKCLITFPKYLTSLLFFKLVRLLGPFSILL